MNHLPFDGLEVLIAISKTRNFREAAGRIGLSLASVSNKLAVLQEQVDRPLLTFDGKRKVLTPFGKALSEVAALNFERFDREIHETEQLHGDSTALRLTIACRPEVFTFLAGRLPEDFRLQFLATRGQDVANAVLRGEADFGFTSIVPNSGALIAKKAFQSTVDLVIHKALIERRRASAVWNDPEAICHLPALAYGQDGHFLRDICREHGLGLRDLNVKVIAESWTALAALVDERVGYALVPAYVRTRPDVVRQPLPERVCERRDFYLVVRAAFREVPAFKILLKTKWI